MAIYVIENKGDGGDVLFDEGGGAPGFLAFVRYA